MSIYLNNGAEKAAVKALGEDIGFGRIIQLAHQCWDEMLEAKHGIKGHGDLQAAQARIKVLEGALETFAILANEETDYLPDEHLISLTYDDSDLDDDLGGPNTLLGERFMRAFRRARAALLPQLGGENG